MALLISRRRQFQEAAMPDLVVAATAAGDPIRAA